MGQDTDSYSHNQEVCNGGTVSAPQGRGITPITSSTGSTQLLLWTPGEVCQYPLLPQPPQLPLPGQCRPSGSCDGSWHCQLLLSLLSSAGCRAGSSSPWHSPPAEAASRDLILQAGDTAWHGALTHKVPVPGPTEVVGQKRGSKEVPSHTVGCRVFVFSAGTAAWEAGQGAFPFLLTE